MPTPEAPAATHGPEGVEQRAGVADHRLERRGGWARIVRNAVVGFYMQAGTRLAAALSFYSILAGAPMLVLTLMLGSALFGEELTKAAVAGLATASFPRVGPTRSPSTRSAHPRRRSAWPCWPVSLRYSDMPAPSSQA